LFASATFLQCGAQKSRQQPAEEEKQKAEEICFDIGPHKKPPKGGEANGEVPSKRACRCCGSRSRGPDYSLF